MSAEGNGKQEKSSQTSYKWLVPCCARESCMQTRVAGKDLRSFRNSAGDRGRRQSKQETGSKPRGVFTRRGQAALSTSVVAWCIWVFPANILSVWHARRRMGSF